MRKIWGLIHIVIRSIGRCRTKVDLFVDDSYVALFIIRIYRVKLGHIFLNVKIVSKSYGILIQRETPRKKKNIRREQMVRHISNACL